MEDAWRSEATERAAGPEPKIRTWVSRGGLVVVVEEEEESPGEESEEDDDDDVPRNVGGRRGLFVVRAKGIVNASHARNKSKGRRRESAVTILP